MRATPASLPEMVAASLRQAGVPRRLLVGFSGGADSTALLTVLHELAPDLRCRLEPVHFEHGLRGAAGRADAAWCRRFCAARGLSCQVVPLAVRSSRRPGESGEAAARRLRLAAWRELVGGDPAAAVALGHHADDRAENLLLRLLRGANCSGLTSLRSSQAVAGVRFLRPLLETSRAELRAFLRSRRIRTWREDHTNRDPAMRRNFLRHKLLPLLRTAVPETDAALAAALAALDHDAAFLEAAADAAFAEHAAAALSAPFLRDLHPALRPRVLRRWLEPQLGADFLPDRDLLDRLDQLLRLPRTDGEPRRIPLAGGRELVLARDRLRLAGPPSRPPEPVAWRWRRAATIAWPDARLRRQLLPAGTAPQQADAACAIFPADPLPATLLVRPWQEGDQMVPFGRRHPVGLKKLFTDRKLAGAERFRFPLLIRPEDGAILWVAGLRRSALLPLAPGQPAVRFTWRPPAPGG